MSERSKHLDAAIYAMTHAVWELHKGEFRMCYLGFDKDSERCKDCFKNPECATVQLVDDAFKAVTKMRDLITM